MTMEPFDPRGLTKKYIFDCARFIMFYLLLFTWMYNKQERTDEVSVLSCLSSCFLRGSYFCTRQANHAPGDS